MPRANACVPRRVALPAVAAVVRTINASATRNSARAAVRMAYACPATHRRPVTPPRLSVRFAALGKTASIPTVMSTRAVLLDRPPAVSMASVARTTRPAVRAPAALKEAAVRGRVVTQGPIAAKGSAARITLPAAATSMGMFNAPGNATDAALSLHQPPIRWVTSRDRSEVNPFH
jgi:hypothetical protein